MDYSILSRSPLFRGIAPAQIESILSRNTFRIRQFNAAAMIAQGGDPVNVFMLVTSGTVKGEMTDLAGRIIKIEEISAPGAIAPAFMFGNKNRFPVNVIAVSDVEIMMIMKEDFLSMLKNNESMLVNFLDMISNRSQFLSDKIKFLSFKTIRSKLAHYILELAGGKNEIKLDRTQNDLADYFGVARPSVARAIGDLEELGIIETKGKFIKVLSRSGLAELITE